MVLRIILLLLLLTPILAVLPRLALGIYARPLTFTTAEAPQRQAAIVFGAGLWRDGRPTPVLRDRVAAGAQLYFDGKVQKLIMSGSNPSEFYNEPAAMQAYALSLGVPDEAIVLDPAGFRTYDTCYRARYLYGIRNALLVTQKFHLPRAIYVCNALGLEAGGVASDLRTYRRSALLFWNLREIPATLTALWDIHIQRPQVEIGAPQPIFPLEAQ